MPSLDAVMYQVEVCVCLCVSLAPMPRWLKSRDAG